VVVPNTVFSQANSLVMVGVGERYGAAWYPTMLPRPQRIGAVVHRDRLGARLGVDRVRGGGVGTRLHPGVAVGTILALSRLFGSGLLLS